MGSIVGCPSRWLRRFDSAVGGGGGVGQGKMVAAVGLVFNGGL